jgi:hypothetical protein
MDFRRFYQLESYLFEEVRARFASNGALDAFDFFCIVIWKANRAKSAVAKNLLKHGDASLEDAVRTLTAGIAARSSPKDRMTYLLNEWALRLPMASAILTVLYPDDFTVYDTRVCDTLGQFHNLNNLTSSEKAWEGYAQFKAAVASAAPADLSLRDKDRFLWGKSFQEQLRHDINASFHRDH